MQTDRRSLLRGLSLGAMASAVPGIRAIAQTPQRVRPILFVHGNGDQASIWQTVLWRFESNGMPTQNMTAFSFTDPMARDDDNVSQPNRSSTADQARELAEQIDRVLKDTGADKIALVGSSRGGDAIRNVLTMEGRAAFVSHVVLCGVPNHGVFAWDTALGNEFNGKAPFLQRLNAQPGEITQGPAWLTLRSDGFDKYAQPDGRFAGRPGVPTGITFEGPELKGATNLALGTLDHRETAFSPRAFRELFKFTVGREPDRIAITPEPDVQLSGRVTGMAGATPTNRPVADAMVEVHAVYTANGRRDGPPLWSGRTGADGAWGPLTTTSATPLEFVVTVAGSPVTHIYRSPFARSSTVVDLRPARPIAPAESGAAAIIVLSRPRGYFGLPRDVVLFDGKEPTDVKPGVPTDSISTLRLTDATDRPIFGVFNQERIAVRPWPSRDGHFVIAELTY